MCKHCRAVARLLKEGRKGSAVVDLALSSDNYQFRDGTLATQTYLCKSVDCGTRMEIQLRDGMLAVELYH